jgi:Putative transmembrane protein (PGPGW)
MTTTLGVSLVVLVASVLMVHYFLITIPADYFAREHKPLERWRNLHPALRVTLLVVKNVVGALLIVVGVVMFVTPGQGMLTVLLGLTLVDFPGKRALERRIIERPIVLKVVNRLRTRANRPPLMLL